MPVGAAIGGAAIIGGVATTRASDRTARAAETTATTNNNLQRQVYDRNVQAQAPYLQAGGRSLAAWESLMGLGTAPSQGVSSIASQSGSAPRPGLAARGYDAAQQIDVDGYGGPQINPGQPGGGMPNALAGGGALGSGGAGQVQGPGQANALTGYDSFRRSLGYQQGLDEGHRSMNLNMANRGQLLSGDAAREAARFGTNYAQRWAGNYLDRLQQGTMLGAGAANALAGVGTNYAGAVSANNNNALNVQSGAWQSGAQGIGDMAGNIAGGVAYGYGNNWGRSPAAQGSSYQASSGYGRPISWGF